MEPKFCLKNQYVLCCHNVDLYWSVVINNVRVCKSDQNNNSLVGLPSLQGFISINITVKLDYEYIFVIGSNLIASGNCLPRIKYSCMFFHHQLFKAMKLIMKCKQFYLDSMLISCNKRAYVYTVCVLLFISF